MKKLIVLIFITLWFGDCFSQQEKVRLSDKIELTKRDLLDLKLQILAAQLTSGSYSILDMGRVNFPVSITLNDQDEIVFKIEKRIDTTLPEETQKEIMLEGFVFVNTAIADLILRNFPKLNYDNENNITGNWYFELSPIVHAKWEKNKFEWVKYGK